MVAFDLLLLFSSNARLMDLKISENWHCKHVKRVIYHLTHFNMNYESSLYETWPLKMLSLNAKHLL